MKNAGFSMGAQRMMKDLVNVITERVEAEESTPDFVPSTRMLERMDYWIVVAGDYEDQNLHKNGTPLIVRLQHALEVQRAYDRHQYGLTLAYVTNAINQVLTEYNNAITKACHA